MSTPVIVWTAITGIFVATVIIRFSVEMMRYFREDYSHGIFSAGTEREEFFAPGDPEENDKDLLNDED